MQSACAGAGTEGCCGPGGSEASPACDVLRHGPLPTPTLPVRAVAFGARPSSQLRWNISRVSGCCAVLGHGDRSRLTMGRGTGGVCALHSSHGGRDGLRPFPKLAGWDKTLPRGFLGTLLSLFFEACSRSEPVNCKYIRQNPADSNLSYKLQIVGNYIFMLYSHCKTGCILVFICKL